MFKTTRHGTVSLGTVIYGTVKYGTVIALLDIKIKF